jgi:hypothetical protein
LHPRSHRRLGQVEVPRDLADRAVAALAQLDDLGLELRGERSTGTGFLFSIVSILDILSGALPLMVDVRQNGESPLGDTPELAWPEKVRSTWSGWPDLNRRPLDPQLQLQDSP